MNYKLTSAVNVSAVKELCAGVIFIKFYISFLVSE